MNIPKFRQSTGKRKSHSIHFIDKSLLSQLNSAKNKNNKLFINENQDFLPEKTEKKKVSKIDFSSITQSQTETIERPNFKTLKQILQSNNMTKNSFVFQLQNPSLKLFLQRNRTGLNRSMLGPSFEALKV